MIAGADKNVSWWWQVATLVCPLKLCLLVRALGRGPGQGKSDGFFRPRVRSFKMFIKSGREGQITWNK